MNLAFYKRIEESTAHRLNREFIRDYILQNPEKLQFLIEIALNEKDKIHIKACWSLELIFEIKEKHLQIERAEEELARYDLILVDSKNEFDNKKIKLSELTLSKYKKALRDENYETIQQIKNTYIPDLNKIAQTYLSRRKTYVNEKKNIRGLINNTYNRSFFKKRVYVLTDKKSLNAFASLICCIKMAAYFDSVHAFP
jgi:hypothetical protein